MNFLNPSNITVPSKIEVLATVFQASHEVKRSQALWIRINGLGLSDGFARNASAWAAGPQIRIGITIYRYL
jgi:hypothetical protein